MRKRSAGEWTWPLLSLGLAVVLAGADANGQTPATRDTSRGDRMIADYFRTETARLSERCLADIETLEDWTSRREEYRRQLFEMLGLDPLPERTPLNPEVTARTDHKEFTVERLHFQSRPGLYVTGNLYLPKNRGADEKLPAVLYVCGHARVKKDGISYGGKAHYQHHGGWFARNGYACLIIDTLQMGEIEGLHHGTYHENMWWWFARGYTPAGVEAWNCIRALDYLQSRPEIDGERIGVTGRSGGGAYSWWIAALDDRIKCAVPVAGITDLENHVVDGVIEGHCDCMFMVHTYRWDYPLVAALVAPRPLLISNTDKDPIFPLEGVVRLHSKVRKIYQLYGAGKSLGLHITEGPHTDTQELRIHAFHWMNKHLKKEDPLIDTVATKLFEPAELRVFQQLPEDAKNANIHDTFTPTANISEAPKNAAEWKQQRDGWLAVLKQKSFAGWPEELGPLDVKPALSAQRDGIQLSAYDFTSQDNIRLRLYVLQRAGLKPEDLELVVLNSVDEAGWKKFLASVRPAFAEELKDEVLPEADTAAYEDLKKMFSSFKWGMAYVAPRGVGPTLWDQTPKKHTQHQRRFQLLGQTWDGMQVWDVRRAAQALRSVAGMKDIPLWMQGERSMAGIVLYASLFEPDVARLDLWNLPQSHHEGPYFLNVLRFLDVPQAVAMAAERSKVRIYQDSAEGWDYAKQTAAQLGWDEKQLQIRVAKPE